MFITTSVGREQSDLTHNSANYQCRKGGDLIHNSTHYHANCC